MISINLPGTWGLEIKTLSPRPQGLYATDDVLMEELTDECVNGMKTLR
jgi:hypothetical protein